MHGTGRSTRVLWQRQAPIRQPTTTTTTTASMLYKVIAGALCASAALAKPLLPADEISAFGTAAVATPLILDMTCQRSTTKILAKMERGLPTEEDACQECAGYCSDACRCLAGVPYDGKDGYPSQPFVYRWLCTTNEDAALFADQSNNRSHVFAMVDSNSCKTEVTAPIGSA